jgi:hypothetical protein
MRFVKNCLAVMLFLLLSQTCTAEDTWQDAEDARVIALAEYATAAVCVDLIDDIYDSAAEEVEDMESAFVSMALEWETFHKYFHSSACTTTGNNIEQDAADEWEDIEDYFWQMGSDLDNAETSRGIARQYYVNGVTYMRCEQYSAAIANFNLCVYYSTDDEYYYSVISFVESFNGADDRVQDGLGNLDYTLDLWDVWMDSCEE